MLLSWGSRLFWWAILVGKRLYSVSGKTWIHVPTHPLIFSTYEFAWPHSPRNSAYLSIRHLWKGTQTKHLISQVGCWDADTLEVCWPAWWRPMDSQADLTGAGMPTVNNASTPMHPAADRHSVSDFPRVFQNWYQRIKTRSPNCRLQPQYTHHFSPSVISPILSPIMSHLSPISCMMNQRLQRKLTRNPNVFSMSCLFSRAADVSVHWNILRNILFVTDLLESCFLFPLSPAVITRNFSTLYDDVWSMNGTVRACVIWNIHCSKLG